MPAVRVKLLVQLVGRDEHVRHCLQPRLRQRRPVEPAVSHPPLPAVGYPHNVEVGDEDIVPEGGKLP